MAAAPPPARARRRPGSPRSGFAGTPSGRSPEGPAPKGGGRRASPKPAGGCGPQRRLPLSDSTVSFVPRSAFRRRRTASFIARSVNGVRGAV